MKRFYKFIMITVVLFIPAATNAQVATGANYTLEQSVIAGGGVSDSVGGRYVLDGTTGQAAAGAAANGPGPDHHNGFWTAKLITTAAVVSISGRVLASNGTALRNALVSFTDSQNVVRTVSTGSFGYYCFEGAIAGQSYLVSVTSRRFQYTPIFLVVIDTLTDVDFVPNP